jgi:hypothetical protein
VTRGATSPAMVTCALIAPTLRIGLISAACPTCKRNLPVQVSIPGAVALIVYSPGRTGGKIEEPNFVASRRGLRHGRGVDNRDSCPATTAELGSRTTPRTLPLPVCCAIRIEVDRMPTAIYRTLCTSDMPSPVSDSTDLNREAWGRMDHPISEYPHPAQDCRPRGDAASHAGSGERRGDASHDSGASTCARTAAQKGTPWSRPLAAAERALLLRPWPLNRAVMDGEQHHQPFNRLRSLKQQGLLLATRQPSRAQGLRPAS